LKLVALIGITEHIFYPKSMDDKTKVDKTKEYGVLLFCWIAG
jgi:hypothetical protein